MNNENLTVHFKVKDFTKSVKGPPKVNCASQARNDFHGGDQPFPSSLYSNPSI
jgi:hypothetical protein